MKAFHILPLTGLILFALLTGANASEPLVSAEWLLKNHTKTGLVFLDVRNAGVFNRGTIPGAVNTDYGRHGWRVKKNGVPGMLPTKAKLEKLIGGLGVGNNDHVIIMPGGYSAGEMGVATRIYWTFKIAGHDQVSILNGGLNAYFSLKKPIVGKGIRKPVPISYEVRLRPELVATSQDIRMALKTGTPLIDNRPTGQYLGINKSSAPRRAGTLKAAVNVPGQWMTVNGGGTFRSTKALKTLFRNLDARNSGTVINFCNTGHWASLGWFITHELMGNKNARLYDGSMAEWTRSQKNPVEIKVPLN